MISYQKFFHSTYLYVDNMNILNHGSDQLSFISDALNELSFKISTGIVDLKNLTHVEILREILIDKTANPEIVNEIINNIKISQGISLVNEAFPVIDPKTGKKKNFFNPDNYKLALAGKHPKYPGIHFKKYQEVEDAPTPIRVIKKTREELYKYKKSQIVKFLLFLKRYLRLPKFKRIRIVKMLIDKFSISKNSKSTNLFVENSYTNFKKHVHKSGADLIKIFEADGGVIPIRGVQKPKEKPKLFTRGDKESRFDSLYSDLEKEFQSPN